MNRIVLMLLLISSLAVQAFAGSWVDDFEGGVSGFGAADEKANGISSTTQARSGTKSMLCQQVPTETRPNRLCAQNSSGTPPTTGTVTLYVFDDGADIKAFDVRVSDDVVTAAIGLRDSSIGSSTNYTSTLNGVTAATPVARSIGWHKFQFQVNSAGVDLHIDNAGWAGSSFAGMTQIRRLQIQTNFGSPTDANNLWIDDAAFAEGSNFPVTKADNWQQFN